MSPGKWVFSSPGPEARSQHPGDQPRGTADLASAPAPRLPRTPIGAVFSPRCPHGGGFTRREARPRRRGQPGFNSRLGFQPVPPTIGPVDRAPEAGGEAAAQQTGVAGDTEGRGVSPGGVLPPVPGAPRRAGASAGWGCGLLPAAGPLARGGQTQSPGPRGWRVVPRVGSARRRASPAREGGSLSRTPLRMPTPVPGRLPQFPATLPGPSSCPAGDRSSNPVQLRWGLGSSCQPFRSQALLWLRHVTCGPSAQPGPLSRTGVAVGMSGPRLRPRSRCFRGHAGSSGGRSTPRDRQPRAFASQGSESLLADGFSLRWPRGTAATFLRGHSPFADAEEPTRPPAWFPPPDNWE